MGCLLSCNSDPNRFESSTILVSYSAEIGQQTYDGRILLILADNNESEPRFQVSEGLNAQPIFAKGEHTACNPDSIFKNSPTFNGLGTPPEYNNKNTIQDVFRKKIGKVKDADGKLVFKCVLDCNGTITDVWVFRSSRKKKFNKKFLKAVKATGTWKPALFKDNPVDFELTFIGVILKRKIYIGTQLDPPKEWFEVKQNYITNQ